MLLQKIILCWECRTTYEIRQNARNDVAKYQGNLALLSFETLFITVLRIFYSQYCALIDARQSFFHWISRSEGNTGCKTMVSLDVERRDRREETIPEQNEPENMEVEFAEDLPGRECCVAFCQDFLRHSIFRKNPHSFMLSKET